MKALTCSGSGMFVCSLMILSADARFLDVFGVLPELVRFIRVLIISCWCWGRRIEELICVSWVSSVELGLVYQPGALAILGSNPSDPTKALFYETKLGWQSICAKVLKNAGFSRMPEHFRPNVSYLCSLFEGSSFFRYLRLLILLILRYL